MKHKTLKHSLRKILSNPDQNEARRRILELPLKQLVSPLISFLYAADETLKWRSVTILGTIVSEIAKTDMESARVVMRRLMWNLNDESGGIGWGSPEAMGEIMAQHRQLAREYGSILVSYIREDGNYIEHEILQRGVLWGLGRLARNRPESIPDIAPVLIPFLTSKDPFHRGLAVWTAGALPSPLLSPYLQELTNDDTVVEIYQNWQLTERSIGKLASDALSGLSS